MSENSFDKFFLDNGLEVILLEDPGTQMAVVNLLYKVGSRHEVEGKSGLAHFFEHLMFGGSKNAKHFDRILDHAGGSCNAFTSPDITNYYISLPAVNLETALWLESDRMFQLSLTAKTIETQRKVVLEEFKQRYLNQPYGDAFHHLRALAYDRHAYRWPTIGESLDHVEGYTEEDVIDFYEMHYSPDNAILVIAGDISKAKVKSLVEKWFGGIKPSNKARPMPIIEPKQSVRKEKSVYKNVPTDSLYKAYKMPARGDNGYFEADLITDLLGFGNSSILQDKLVKNGKLFSTIGSYILGSVDPGLLVFSGKMEDGVPAETAEKELDLLVEEFLETETPEKDLQKIRNQSEAMKTFENIKILKRVMNLAYHAHLGDPNNYLAEFEIKNRLGDSQIKDWGKRIIQDNQSSVVYYKAEK